jgi:hypothetical protein
MRKTLVAVPVLIGVGAILPWGFFLGTTDFVPGDKTRFDPVAQLPDVASFACAGCKLVELSADGVASTGTVDLSAAYEPRVEYEFEGAPVSTNDAANAAVPIGARDNEVMHYNVSVAGPGMNGSGSHVGYANFISFGMDRDEFPRTHNDGSSAVALPCSFKRLWERAMAKGAPEEAVARIKYSRRGYELVINGTDHRYEFDADCELSEKKRRGRRR